MNSPESGDRYWAEQIKTLAREIAELESFLGNSQNAISPEGEDTSETMANAETDLMQTKTALQHARVELIRIKQQEEIAKLLPQIEERRRQIKFALTQSDNEGAKELEEVLKELEARVQELQKDPVIDEEVE